MSQKLGKTPKIWHHQI